MSPGVERRRISLHQYDEVLLLSNVCPVKGLQDYNEQLSPGPSTCCLHMLLSISLLQIKYLYMCATKFRNTIKCLANVSWREETKDLIASDGEV